MSLELDDAENLTAEIVEEGQQPKGFGSEYVPMKRDTVEEIVQRYNETLKALDAAYDALEVASASVRKVNRLAESCCPSGITNMNHERHREIEAFYNAVCLPSREQYLLTGRKILMINVWSHVITSTRLESLMDQEAKEALRKQMAYEPPNKSRGEVATKEDGGLSLPEITVENIMATIQAFVDDAPNIMARGMARAFEKLDRRFRSHNGFKIGERIIITNALSEYGRFNWGRVHDAIVDVERIFTVLDGRVDGTFTETVKAIDHDRYGKGTHQSVTETEYFRVRGYKNGNAHIWFKRDDLVDEVNQILGKYYGEPLGDDEDKETVREPDPLKAPKTELAKYFGFYPTPEKVVHRVMDSARIYRRCSDRPLRILEPSAGTGNLARPAVIQVFPHEGELHQEVDCIEVQPHLAESLRAEGIYHKVTCADFLQVEPTPVYDRIIMNPPFDMSRDIDHVVHALGFLAEDGILVSIMSASTEFKETKKAQAFRDLMEKMGASWQDLPAGSFSEMGTNVNTIILTVHKNRRRY